MHSAELHLVTPGPVSNCLLILVYAVCISSPRPSALHTRHASFGISLYTGNFVFLSARKHYSWRDIDCELWTIAVCMQLLFLVMISVSCDYTVYVWRRLSLALWQTWIHVEIVNNLPPSRLENNRPIIMGIESDDIIAYRWHAVMRTVRANIVI